MSDKTAVFLEYKSLLFSIAYNLLGEVDTAEDIVQDTYLKWMDIGDTPVRHIKAYLGKIVTNKCINYLTSARSRREEYVGIWLPEPILDYRQDAASQLKVESYHALSIGLLLLLEKLTPQERAVFLLREVFTYEYFELAEIFEKTEDNCRQIFRRAKDNLGKDVRRFTADLKAHERILKNFLQAVSEGHLEDLIGILKADIVLFADGGGTSIPVDGQRLTAALKPIYGRDNVLRFLLRSSPKFYTIPDLSQELVLANGTLSTLSYKGSSPLGLTSFEIVEEKIAYIYVQTNPVKLSHIISNHHE